ncbi:MAG: PAS domain S-box protein [Syntrophales bacterium]
MKILAIDDKQDNLTSLKAILKDAFPEAKTFIALNGPKGIELALAENPDVILLDIVMPGMDGFEVCRKLKENERLRFIPVVFLTALKTSRENRIKALKAGAEGFLPKPLDEVELIAQIRSMAKIKTADQLRQMEKEELAALVTERTRELERELAEHKLAEESMRIAHKRLKWFVDANIAGIVVVDPSGTIFEANDYFLRMIGYTRKEFEQGKVDWRAITPPEWLAADEQAIRELRERGTCVPYEKEHFRRDGTRVPVLVTDAVLPGPEDHIVAITLDLTERKRADKALQESNETLRTLVHSSPLAIIALDPDGNVTQWNSAAERMFGWQEHEVLGQFLPFVPEDKREEYRALRERALRGEAFINVEVRRRKKDGSPIDISVSTAPLHDSRGQINGIMSVISDITELKRAEVALRESEKLYRSLFENMLNGFAYCQMHFDDQDRPYDFTFLAVNSAFETMTGLRDIVGKKVSVVIPEIRTADPKLFDIYARVAKDGQPERFEIFLESLQMWLWISVYTPKYGYFVTAFNVITERKRAEAERERLMAAIEQAGEMILMTDPAGTIQYVNPAFERITGYTCQEAIEQNPRILKSGRQNEAFYSELWATISRGDTWQGRIVNKRKDGTLYTEEATISPVRDAAGKIANYVAVKRDITEHLRLTAQFQQAQKMESVGRLAGGVAHDYNNMIGVIMGYTEMALNKLDPSQPLHADLQQIKKAAQRSADLTRQLLAFARKQTIAPVVLDLNRTMESILKMLRQLIGEDIDLAWLPGADLWPVKLDPSQLDQLLANLCINARDAITGVGKITIETDTAIFDEAYCGNHEGFVPGDFVLLAVSDDGCGIGKETQDKLFEPFFTTKEVGKGTGLGLATVYGIVKQNNGFINVYSELGQGTTFKIYLPRHEGKAEQMQKEGPVIPSCQGHETILLVEDEPTVMEITTMILEKLGYKVLAALTPGEAIRLAEKYAGEILLLLTDVVMPDMNGRDLAKKLLSLYPNLKCLFMSGYTANVIAHHGVLDAGVHFIQKPFSMKDLAAKVCEVLHGE